MDFSPAQIAKGDQTLAALADDYAWLVNQAQTVLADGAPIQRVALLNHHLQCVIELSKKELAIMLAYAIDRAALDQIKVR